MSGAQLELKRLYPKLLLLAAALGLVVGAIQPAQAQYVESLPYTFTGGNDGAYPAASLISDSQGNLYGTAAYGGPSSCPGFNPPTGCGVVFELTPPPGGSGQWTENILYPFTGGSDGAYPQASLVFDSKGNLYGTTANGGDTGGTNCSAIGGCGVVFELSPPSGGGFPWNETVLYTFTGGSDGSVPYANVIFDSEKVNLYGTTTGGGIPPGCLSNCGFGVVYELSPPAGGSGSWTETLLYVFTGGSDGDTPQAGLIFDTSGNLYGTTLNGGSRTCAGGHLGPCGVVFELSPPSGGGAPWNEFVLYAFKGSSDGANPWAGVIFDSKGKSLYGTTTHGGNMSGSTCSATYGCGVVLELSPPSGGGGGTWTETVPYAFTGGSDGGYPEASLIFDANGNLYGTTSLGGDIAGTNCSPSGCGVVFELTPPAGGGSPWNPKQLYTFQGGSDGGFPLAGLLSDAALDLFGTTSAGGDTSASNCTGAGGCGVVFELNIPGAPVATLSPTSLTFGSQLVGTTSKAQTVTLTNTGSSTLDIYSITVSVNFGMSTNCGATLAVGKSCTVSVTFSPTQGGQLTGNLTFTDNAPNSPQQVSLSGTGIPQAALTPTSANFGKVKVGTTSKPKKFTLTNNQSVTLTNIAISTTGDFGWTTTCGATLGAKKKCSISVTFTPTQTGTRTGQLSVSDSAIGSPQTASLTGTGK